MAERRVIVIGSGPIRIGQGIEFDYCSVHCAWALRAAGYKAIIINSNPETVSTDFDTSDRLYFEPLTSEDVLNIIEQEQPFGVIVQFGGQTAINLARPLHEAGTHLLGSSFDSIDLAEDRDRFERVLTDLEIAKPPGRAIMDTSQALLVADEIGYPVLVRPSYVLGGRAMEIVYTRTELERYVQYALEASPGAPILVDKYILGKEVEIDVIGDGADCLLPGIMEHIERAGVHSGDSMAVYPPQSLSGSAIERIVHTATLLSQKLEVRGLMNIQFVVDPETDIPQVLEVNPRASRTVPYLSKITGIPIVRVATNAMLGVSIRDQGYTPGLYPHRQSIAVKAPVFSFAKLAQVDIGLGPEMKSTGEIMGLDKLYPRSLYKAMVASGIDVPAAGTMIATVADSDKQESAEIIRGFVKAGFTLYATSGTAKFLQSQGIQAVEVKKLHEGEGNIVDLLKSRRI
ncbi:MAG TPA: carbamoyl-phosphate synthase large subunit, partial [Chthonomonadales bacterium]|nr:carbamoyl-phosphate synthase large subunit [Chthonomonadales bacterium]